MSESVYMKVESVTNWGMAKFVQRYPRGLIALLRSIGGHPSCPLQASGRGSPV